MLLAEALHWPAYKSRHLGRNDLQLQHEIGLVRFAPNADGSSGTVARLIPEIVPPEGDIGGWTVEPFSDSTEVHLLCHLCCCEGESYNWSTVFVALIFWLQRRSYVI